MGEGKLECTGQPYQKGHRIIFHILSDMGHVQKFNNSKIIKDRNIIFAVSLKYINIH